MEIFEQITMDKDSNCGFIRTIPSYQKYKKITIAMSSQVGQSNDKWRDIEKPKSYIENQTDEDIEPITPFNLMKAHIKWKNHSTYRKMTNYKEIYGIGT